VSEVRAAARKRILVVDDEEDVQILVCRILRDLGYEVQAASDGAQAMEMILVWRPDLLVLDLMMPGVDGWGVLARLRETRDPLPVVVLTARTDYSTLQRGIREGAAAYVCKPFRFHELVATCQSVLLSTDRKAPVHERRQRVRQILRLDVDVLTRERAPIAPGKLVNLSLGGAQVALPNPLTLGESIRVAVHLPGGSTSSLGLEGRVQWRDSAGGEFIHGLTFQNLTGEEERQLRELLY
jgi:DNA-binding response OmpR family regulator